MIAAVRVRGNVDAREKVSRTLNDLKLRKKNQCVVFEENKSVEGMMKLAKDYIAYGEIDDDTVEKLEERSGTSIESGSTVKLSPPTGGFKDTKGNVGQGGSLGKRSDMDELINKMV